MPAPDRFEVGRHGGEGVRRGRGRLAGWKGDDVLHKGDGRGHFEGGEGGGGFREVRDRTEAGEEPEAARRTGEGEREPGGERGVGELLLRSAIWSGGRDRLLLDRLPPKSRDRPHPPNTRDERHRPPHLPGRESLGRDIQRQLRVPGGHRGGIHERLQDHILQRPRHELPAQADGEARSEPEGERRPQSPGALQDEDPPQGVRVGGPRRGLPPSERDATHAGIDGDIDQGGILHGRAGEGGEARAHPRPRERRAGAGIVHPRRVRDAHLAGHLRGNTQRRRQRCLGHLRPHRASCEKRHARGTAQEHVGEGDIELLCVHPRRADCGDGAAQEVRGRVRRDRVPGSEQGLPAGREGRRHAGVPREAVPTVRGEEGVRVEHTDDGVVRGERVPGGSSGELAAQQTSCLQQETKEQDLHEGDRGRQGPRCSRIVVVP
mmetsp:Transcript_44643/g.95002  ORF Transcript_44643/g.95002 Transcript_44643/m.95002 type:complete len:434 (-) Transcript_44643:436-1737(-)